MPDKNEALEEMHQIRRAADQGDCDARYTLAAYYEHAAGGRQDLEQAAYWYRQAALQGHKAAIEKCGNMGVDLNAPRIERELMRRKLQCRIFPIGFLERYKYTVICAAYQGKWLLSRHRQRSTWETQGGHIEAGETPLACAKRELFEESGVRDAEIYPVCDYWGFNRYGCSNGMVFLAVVHALGELPESEMKEIRAFAPVPAIICIAISSNLQGAATLVGDTTSILLAKAAGLSLHCWQGDDVTGFDHDGPLTGGIQTTGNYPGKAKTPQQLMQDMEEAMSLMPGKKKINLNEKCMW